jgi:peptidyl-prolyl cis-trans isomerase C
MKDGVGLGEERGKIEPKDVEPTVWALKAGEVSGLIETPAGYHIVRVAEREYAGVRPFDEKVQKEVRGKLMRQLQDREYRRMVEDLWWKGVARIIEVP